MGTRESIRFAYVSGPLMDYVTCVTRADNRTWRKNNNNSLWSSRAYVFLLTLTPRRDPSDLI